MVRRLDAVLDLSWLRGELAPYFSHTGCPSVDPELMIRMMLLGYCYSIRSDRRLCQEIEINLAYRWFCRLGLEDRVPDHSTFSVNRHGRFRDSDVLRHVFESVVRSCMDVGLVGGAGCQRRSKISPPGRSKTSPLNVMRYAVLGGSCGPTGSTIAPAVNQVFLGISAVFGFG